MEQTIIIYKRRGKQMKTKTYTFTEIEVMALKEATKEYYFQRRNLKPISPVVQKMQAALLTLKDQFDDDFRLWK